MGNKSPKNKSIETTPIEIKPSMTVEQTTSFMNICKENKLMTTPEFISSLIDVGMCEEDSVVALAFKNKMSMSGYRFLIFLKLFCAYLEDYINNKKYSNEGVQAVMNIFLSDCKKILANINTQIQINELTHSNYL